MTISETSPTDYLAKEIEAAQRLLQLLEQEEAHLVSADVDGLSAVIGEKANIAIQMSELAKRRHAVLVAAGFEASEAGMQAWLNTMAATAAANRTWQELLSLAESGKERNRINGLLITQQLACNQNALNALQGTPQGGGVYGPNGQSANKIASRRLVVG